MSVRTLPRLAWLVAAMSAAIVEVNAVRSASAQGVVPNPEFDVAAVAEWTGDIASLAWSQTDPDCVPANASGSLLVSPADLQTPATAFLCVAAPPAGGWNFSFVVRAECEEVVQGILRYYSEPACGGTFLGSEETGGTTLGGSWDQAELAPTAPPLGTQSIWIGLKLSQSITSMCDARFDKIHLGSGIPLLRSGFETGSSACRWSATVP